MKRNYFLSVVLAVLVLLGCVHTYAQMPEVVLAIGEHKITAEVARTEDDRALGLMNRRMLPEARGMLFVFPSAEYHAMWMKNTYVPLSVAFIDAKGVIINIEDMQPHTEDSHAAARPAKYALEMNRGWFKKRGLNPGARIEGLERAGSGR
jgi:uncharacterized membrane protein (UPF0127 family)